MGGKDKPTQGGAPACGGDARAVTMASLLCRTLGQASGLGCQGHGPSACVWAGAAGCRNSPGVCLQPPCLLAQLPSFEWALNGPGASVIVTGSPAKPSGPLGWKAAAQVLWWVKLDSGGQTWRGAGGGSGQAPLSSQGSRLCLPLSEPDGGQLGTGGARWQGPWKDPSTQAQGGPCRRHLREHLPLLPRVRGRDSQGAGRL